MIKHILVCIYCIFYCSLTYAIPDTEGIQTYQKTVPLSAEHKRNLADDIVRYRNADNIWDVLREEFTLAHYEDNPAVQDKIDWYMNNQDHLLRSATRAAPYLYYILQQVKKRHLPAELVLLPIIESGYNPFSLSVVGAAGIWQLMPATAADLGIKQDWGYDGRRDVIASTGAALNHLAYLESVYEGNWLLAFAAYDTGEGNLHAAMVKNIRSGKDTDFWSLPVATETKNYVPSLLALAVIISHPELYPVYLPPVRNAPYLAQVDVAIQMSLKHAALLAGISYKKLMQLNPGYNRPLIPTKSPFKLILPIESVEQFTEGLVRTNPAALLKIKNSEVSEVIEQLQPIPKIGTKYIVQPGDTVYIVRNQDTFASVAKHFHMNIALLRSANPDKLDKLSPGHLLTIPTHVPQDPDSTLQPGDTIYIVRQGDTVENIAYKFHTSPASIRLANLLNSNSVQEGERLVVPTHLQS